MRTSAGLSYSRIEITKDSRTKCLGRVHESRDEVLASHCNPPRAVYSYRKSMERTRNAVTALGTELSPDCIFDYPVILRACQGVCFSPERELYSDKIVRIAKTVRYFILMVLSD
ncbi:hypothetical protein AVEN_67198-1 [Araneus ventricosus]|uniref:Uncharacterized protein n=1 Tax=Araneus ventricosus TaxID=182803 RepID=A0A4Y1ZT01_ARAVE|nr:hypothetical protein AVEN_51499-1 [Araneus ventricosus]GBM27038.1 hypothetical protein AVEN_146904-1 [Araneus ventricosus]GBN30017.1 hypothetical protein AVEN_67198-1 [Araneus ventricosus]